MSFSEAVPGPQRVSIDTGVPSLGLCAGNHGWDFMAVLEGAQFLLAGERGASACSWGGNC